MVSSDDNPKIVVGGELFGKVYSIVLDKNILKKASKDTGLRIILADSTII